MDREEAIKIIDCYDIGFYDLSGEKIPADKLADAFDMAIEALSAEPKWIPVSERLPEYREIVLVSSFWGVTVAIRDAIKEDGTDDFWDLLLRDSDVDTRYIYAWMPLPDPYREDDTE